jgi:chemotaxis signal transduction protein
VKKLVVFRTSSGEFAIPVESVREVRSDAALATIPGAHPAVAGLLDWKGEALTVIEIFGPGRQLIVIEGGPGAYGLIVEEVLELAHRSDRELGRAPAEGSASYVTGVMRSEGHLVPIVDAGLLWSSVGFEAESDAGASHTVGDLTGTGGDLTGAGPGTDGGMTPPNANVAL